MNAEIEREMLERGGFRVGSLWVGDMFIAAVTVRTS